MKYLSFLVIPFLVACSNEQDEFLTMAAGDNKINIECKNLISTDAGVDQSGFAFLSIKFSDEEGEKMKTFSQENMGKNVVFSYKDKVISTANIYAELGSNFMITAGNADELLHSKELLSHCLAVR